MAEQPEAPDSFSAEAVADVVQGAERLAREQVARVIADRFRQIEPAVRARLDREFEQATRARLDEARREANREYSEQLSRCVRRMREESGSWGEALLDGTVGLCRAAALFAVSDGKLSLVGTRGGARAAAAEFGGAEVGNGSALEGVVNGGRTGFASRHELPSGVAALLGRGADARVALVPVAVGGEVRSVLCAEGVADLGALEMIAAIAAAVLEARSAPSRSEPQPQPANREALPADIAARRFARMAVSRIVLEHFGALLRGRAMAAVYREVAEPLNAAREEYVRAHLSAAGRDWLHEEIVRSLGQGRVEALGSEYPGPLA